MILELPLALTNDAYIDILTSATSHAAAAGKVDLAVMQLSKGVHVYDRNTPPATVLGDIATYDGYDDLPLTFSPATGTDDGNIEFQGEVAEFRPTGSVLTNTIKNISVWNAGKTKLYGVANFEGDGVPMGSTLDNIKATVALRADGTSVVYVRT